MRLFRRQKGNPEWALRAERDEADTRRLLASVLERDSRAVDVGAHAGTFLDLLLRYAPDGEHVAVEPLPDFAERLRKRYRTVRVVEAALAAKDGSAEFHRPLKRPAWSGLERQQYPEGTDVETFEVRLTRLDAIADGDVRLVKIDVEGAEASVFSGADGLLAGPRPVVLFEHAHIHARGYGTTAAAIHGVLARYGYELFGLDGNGPWDEATFTRICDAAEASGYDRTAQTNFVARPA